VKYPFKLTINHAEFGRTGLALKIVWEVVDQLGYVLCT